MTPFAGYARLHRLEIQPSIRLSIRRVATEAGLTFILCKLASKGFLDAARCESLIPCGGIETINCRIKTHKALIKSALSHKNPRLRTCTEAPKNGRRYGMHAIGDCIRAVAPTGFDGVCICALPDRQLWVRLQHGILPGECERQTHRRQWLGHCLGRVTARARAPTI